MMQSKWNRIQSGTARGTWVALLSVLIILLFAATAGVAQGPAPSAIQVSQVNWYNVFPDGGGVLAGDASGGSSWGINSKGAIVVSSTYGGHIYQFSGPGYAVTVAGPVGGASGVAIDSSDNLFIGTQYSNPLAKVPMNPDGTYTFTVDPNGAAASTLPTCTGTDTSECLIKALSTSVGYVGTASMVFDAAGDLFIATDDKGTTHQYSIYECNATCLYGPTFTAPVLIYAEPISTTVSTTGQLNVGTLAFDPWGNLFFTDAAVVASGNGEDASSNLNELPVSTSGTTGFAATPTVLATFNDPTPLSHYNDSMDTLYINPTTGTVYFALQNAGIWGMTNTQTGGPNPASIWGITSRGAKLLHGDNYGNFFFFGYDNDNSADTLGYISFGSPIIAPATTTASIIVADNTEPCSTLTTTALTLAFADSEYSASNTGCSGMALGTGSLSSYTITFTANAGVTVPPTATLTVTDPTSSTTTSTGVTGEPLTVSQSTYLTAFPSGGVFGGGAAGGTTAAINSMGTVVMGSSYGNGILEFTQGGTVLTNIGNSKYGGANGMAIDNQNYLYMTTEYGNTMLKAPMGVNGLYPALPTTTAALGKLPKCTGDGSAVDSVKLCQMTPGGSSPVYGVAGIVIDSNGNAFISSDNTTSGTKTPSTPTSILWCSANCLYGTAEPVVLFAEPAPDAAGDQLFIGGLALDQSGDIFFTDDLLDGGGNGYNHYSDLYELQVDSTTATGYAAAPTLLYTYTPPCASAPCDYDDELDTVVADANGNIFFADQYDGIYELPNIGGSVDVTNLIPVAAPGTKVMVPDGNGNFYMAAYSSVVNTGGGDTLGFDLVGSVAIAGVATPAAPTTASFYVLDGSGCNSLTFGFSDPEFAVPAGTPGCGGMAFGAASSTSQTVTFTPTGTGTVSATLNLASANGGAGTATITGQAVAVATPTITPASGATLTIGTNNGVFISDATIGATILYTTDGSDPLTSSTAVTYYAPPVPPATTPTGTGAFALPASATITAVATLAGATNSAETTASYTVVAAPTAVATPTVTPASGSTLVIGTSNTITIAETTSGATVLYTTDGTDPLTSSTAQTYSTPFTLSSLGNTIVNAAATLSGNAPSVVAYNSYTVTLPPAATPTFTPATGATLTAGTDTVTIADTTTGAAIYYTIDGSTPTTASTPYTVPFTLPTAGTITVNAIATATGYSSSAVGTVTYTVVAPTVATPTFTPATGATLTVGTNNTVTIADATTGATIYYTTDGSTPTSASNLADGPITLSTAGTVTINAIAELTGDTNSAVATATYTVIVPVVTTVATPTFTPKTGTTLTVGATVTIADTTTGAAIVYTTDGSNPLTSTTATTYSGAITLSTTGTATIMAAATLTGDTSSAVATATYTVNPASGATFTAATSAPTLVITAPGSGTETITLTPTDGFNSPVTFTVSGLPADTTYSFNPATVTPGTTPNNSTVLTINASNPQSSFLRRNSNTFFPAATFAAVLCLFGIRKRRTLQLMLLLAISMVGMGVFTGCGGSSSKSKTLPPATGTVTVTGTTSTTPAVTTTTTFTLTVNYQ